MNQKYLPDEIAEEFEEYYSKSRGMTVVAHGLDVAASIEFAAKVAFFAGYACGLVKVEESLLKKWN